jgi:replicative DNA helicase
MSAVMDEELTTPIAEEEAPVEKVEKYDFDAQFQTKITAMLVRDTVFAQRTDGLIKPEYFENIVEAALVSIAVRYYEKYKRIPADATIYARLIREDLSSKKISGDLARLIVSHYRELLKADVSDRDFVVDQVSIFARHQAVASAIVESVPLLDKHEFDKIDKKLRKAFDTGANNDINAYDYGEMIDARTGMRLDRAAGKLPPAGVTTGYNILDEALYHKGWGRRELSVLLGGAKIGKTTALIDFGRNAVSAGFSVLYVTLEVSDAIIAERLDANISETKMFELGDNVHAVREKVKKFMEAAKARFEIKEFPTGSMTVADLRRYLDRKKAQGKLFDLVIVDYADLMAPERYTDSTVENSKSVYVNLRGLAMAENIAILTATQTNREGFKASVAKAEHVAEDFNKIRIADVIISINRTEEERAANQARLFFAASRNQASGFTIRVEQDIERMRFIKKIIGTE